MRRRLNWQPLSREGLAEHLRSVEVLQSEAIGSANLYRCRRGEQESVAIALPGETGLVIEYILDRPPALERRRPAAGGDPAEEE